MKSSSNIKEKDKDLNTRESKEVYSALINGLDEIDKRDIKRLILTIYESEPDKNATGRWILDNKSNYYELETLDKTEQEMMKEGKHYTVVALVNDRTKEDYRGVEAAYRTHIIPELAKLKPNSQFEYFTDGGISTDESLKHFAEFATENGWTSQIITKRIQAGIQEYDSITKKLMKDAGVSAWIERMEQREYSPLEQIMQDMRKNIANAKSK
jgi:hypothetical protein